MSIENELVITTPDGPPNSNLGRLSRTIRWNTLRATASPGNNLIVYFEQGHFNENQIGILNRIKEHVKLLLFMYKKDEPAFLFNEWALNVSHSLMKRTIAFSQTEVLKRIISAIEAGAQDKLIADAYVIGNSLKVIDCAANRFEIEHKHLKAVTENGILSSEFEIQKDGSHIHWPKFDYHIDIDGLRCKIDENFRKQQSVKYFQDNEKLGIAIRKFRESADLKQTDFQDLSDRHLRRIENGESVPSYSVFETLSRIHKLTVDGYLAALSKYIG
jgi:hypothetical protein